MSDDRGAGTIAVAGLAASLIGLVAMLAPVVAVSAARHRAAAAADAGALAGAAVVGGFGTAIAEDPCAAAEALVARHGGALLACGLDGLVVTVEAAVGTAFGPVAMRATAGPPRAA